MAVVTSPWATLRFRRSKDVKGWALLGIPQHLYSDVMQPLFERQTRFIEKHGRGEFVNVLFEAPVALAARLALAFPAPPSCEPLVVNQAGTRLLYGKFAKSSKARHQVRESDTWPGLQLLSGEESFWQIVITLSNVTTLPLERLSSSPPDKAEQGSKAADLEARKSPVMGTPTLHSAVDVALQSLAEDGLELQRAEALIASSVPTRQALTADGLDEDGFEEDEWEEDGEGSLAEASSAEVFEDVWDTEELEDFGDAPREPIASKSLTQQGQVSLVEQVDDPVVARQGSELSPRRKSLTEASVAPPPSLVPRTRKVLSQGETSLVSKTPVRKTLTSSAAVVQRTSSPLKKVKALSSAVQMPGGQTAEPVQLSASENSVSQSGVVASESNSLGRYCSGLLPNPSDASTLQAYNSGGLTVADAIARTQQQEAQALVEKSQRRRIKLPFEQAPPADHDARHQASQQAAQLPNWFYANASPQLPEESWAAESQMTLAGARPGDVPKVMNQVSDASDWREEHGYLPEQLPHVITAQNGQELHAGLELGEPEFWCGDGSEASPAGSQVEMPVSEALNLTTPGESEWGYYEEGYWVPCESGESISQPAPMAMGRTNTLAPAPIDIVCMPVAEEQHGYILLQGVAIWNDWRRSNPHIRPNLRGAYLNNLDLVGADLHDVDLRFAFLFRADLREADLSLASLLGADLIRADLGGASLWGAALGGAYLSHANLAGADLTHADVQGAYWQGAILDGAIMPDGQWFEGSH